MGAMMDPFEHLLTTLVVNMMHAWQLSEDRTSPLGELCAEAAAVLQFYREQHKATLLPPGFHWSRAWERKHDEV